MQTNQFPILYIAYNLLPIALLLQDMLDEYATLCLSCIYLYQDAILRKCTA